MLQKLDSNTLIVQAQDAAGLVRFDSDSFREGLDIFLSDFNNSGAPEAAIERLRGNVVQVLANRLKVTAYLDRIEARDGVPWMRSNDQSR